MQQQPLFDQDSDRHIFVAQERRTPSVWISELRVLRELGTDDHQIIRRIRLRRGMNILWAREPEGQEQKQLYEDSISGHSAGKTTFCRLLRYVLGEAHFGDEQLRQEIRAAFQNGWIAAQVFTPGTRWAVYRPIAVGAHPFVVRDASLDEALAPDAPREPLDVYRDALNSAVLPATRSDWHSARADLLRWVHVLPWLARDQDCHFANLITWRDPSSESDSPQLDASERHLLLRAMLGLISHEEDKERRANDDRNATRKKLTTKRPALLHQAAVDRKRLEEAFGKELPSFGDGLFREAVTRELDAFERDGLARLDATGVADGEDELAEFEQRLGNAIQAEAEAAARVKEISRSLARQQAALDALVGKITEERRRQLLQDLGPSSGFCNVPMETAQSSGCPLATFSPIRLADRVAEIGLDEQVAQQGGVVAALKNQLKVLQIQLQPLTAATAKARKALGTGRRRFFAQVREVAAFKAQVAHLRRLANDAEQAWREAAEFARDEADLKQKIEQSYKRQDEIREQLTRDLAAFSARFNHFISALMGRSVEGRVTFSGRDIDLKVFHRGERRSSAIKIVRNIAFDLAALACSMEGRGYHPQFLIHDGPREADMSPGLYRKVFLLAQMLEQCAGTENDPAFQYIITTTEAPPVDIQREPWLLEPILDAADPTKRFLGVDL